MQFNIEKIILNLLFNRLLIIYEFPIVQSIDGANSLMKLRMKMKIVIYSEDQAIFQVMKPKN